MARRRSTQKKRRAGAVLPRQPAVDTAEALLAAGERVVARYVREGPTAHRRPIDVLAFVDIGEVLHEATEELRKAAVRRGALGATAKVPRLTPGAFYRAFPPQGRQKSRQKGEALAVFRRALARRIVSSDAYRESTTEVRELADPVIHVDIAAAIRTATARDLAQWQDSANDGVFYALIMHARDPEIAGWLREVNDRALDHLEAFWAEVLPAMGRRCRPEITLRQLAALIRLGIAGIGMDRRIPGSPLSALHVSRPDEPPGDETTIASIAMEALFMGLTEPDPDAPG